MLEKAKDGYENSGNLHVEMQRTTSDCLEIVKHLSPCLLMSALLILVLAVYLPHWPRPTQPDALKQSVRPKSVRRHVF